MRAILFAVLLALATVVPVFADDDGGFRPPAPPVVDVGGPDASGI